MSRVAARPSTLAGRRVGSRRRVSGSAALVVAVAAAGVLLWRPPPPEAGPAASLPPHAAEVWPNAQRASINASLPDGTVYHPTLFLDATASIGMAPEPGGAHLRLLYRAPGGQLRELRRLPNVDEPEFAAVAVEKGTVVWAESTIDASGRAHTELWSADLAGDRPVRRLTADTGQFLYLGSEYDLAIADGWLHWAAASPDQGTDTELRAVSLDGGPVTVKAQPGDWELSRWPYLISIGSGGPIRLHNVVERQTTQVAANPDEVVTCSPSWCRLLVVPLQGQPQSLLIRPDGGDRQVVPPDTALPSVVDVAALDRFEVLTEGNADNPEQSSRVLYLYDITQRRTVEIARGVGTVQSRGGYLWWSTGVGKETVWHTLDMRSI
ncbi:hypothetical protein ACN28C_32930 [Plantactinospora sp. WMMC1484]|uniref:hypothetical protein n=1 Tax=Plantactinospora sp. WMMC1484 TaxID=3404122 RepID=UPI003BF481D3